MVDDGVRESGKQLQKRRSEWKNVSLAAAEALVVPGCWIQKMAASPAMQRRNKMMRKKWKGTTPSEQDNASQVGEDVDAAVVVAYTASHRVA